MNNLIFLDPLELDKFEGQNYYRDHSIKYLKVQEYIFLEKSIDNLFHKMMIRFLFETAARISEALELKVKDIDLKYNKATLLNLKLFSNLLYKVVIFSSLSIETVIFFIVSIEL